MQPPGGARHTRRRSAARHGAGLSTRACTKSSDFTPGPCAARGRFWSAAPAAAAPAAPPARSPGAANGGVRGPARRICRPQARGWGGGPGRARPPPPPSYEVDTPRPSPRTNRTRLVPSGAPAEHEKTPRCPHRVPGRRRARRPGRVLALTTAPLAASRATILALRTNVSSQYGREGEACSRMRQKQPARRPQSYRRDGAAHPRETGGVSN